MDAPGGGRLCGAIVRGEGGRVMACRSSQCRSYRTPPSPRGRLRQAVFFGIATESDALRRRPQPRGRPTVLPKCQAASVRPRNTAMRRSNRRGGHVHRGQEHPRISRKLDDLRPAEDLPRGDSDPASGPCQNAPQRDRLATTEGRNSGPYDGGWHGMALRQDGRRGTPSGGSEAAEKRRNPMQPAIPQTQPLRASAGKPPILAKQVCHKYKHRPPRRATGVCGVSKRSLRRGSLRIRLWRSGVSVPFRGRSTSTQRPPLTGGALVTYWTGRRDAPGPTWRSSRRRCSESRRSATPGRVPRCRPRWW
jgi:hypothetical protein